MAPPYSRGQVQVATPATLAQVPPLRHGFGVQVETAVSQRGPVNPAAQSQW